jgi:hypothetical protein
VTEKIFLRNDTEFLHHVAITALLKETLCSNFNESAMSNSQNADFERPQAAKHQFQLQAGQKVSRNASESSEQQEKQQIKPRRHTWPFKKLIIWRNARKDVKGLSSLWRSSVALI